MSSETTACPCCGFVVFGDRGNWEICPICCWEDDPVQIADPWFSGGANQPCLEEAQRNFTAYGAIQERFVKHVRPPDQNDHQDPQWRPVQSVDRQHVTSPKDIEQRHKLGVSVPYEYWKRA